MTNGIKQISRQTCVGWMACLLALQAVAFAPLEGRTVGGERVDAYDSSAVMIYDPNADLTWLRDWNVNGQVHWAEQLAWASNLQVGAFANWSLPSARNQDGSGPCLEGYNCKGSQFGQLWYQILGNTERSFTNAGPFQNMQHGEFDVYWTGTKNPAYEFNIFSFYLNVGFQGPRGNVFPAFAVAVRPGDVAGPVPEPQTWALLMFGLGTMAVAARTSSGRSVDLAV